VKILVTGATGFTGPPVCAALAERDHDLTAAVRDPARAPEGAKTVTIGDIGPDTDWKPALDGVEAIVHLAGRAHIMRDRAEDPLAAFRAVNRDGTLTLARQAAETGVKRLVFLSSIKVNGEETEDGAYTEAVAAPPADPYGLSKWEAEEGLRALASETGLEVVILRPPLIYGPGVKANFLSLLKLARKGWPLPFGSIRNRRSLLYAGNLADAVALSVTHPEAANRTFLLRDGEDLSVPDLLRRAARAMGRTAPLLPFPPGLLDLAARLAGRGDMIKRTAGSLQVDDGEIRRRLDWQPPFTVEQGLQATADWFIASHP
jgi:nucleoside-diphosphate-sugar epimerase